MVVVMMTKESLSLSVSGVTKDLLIKRKAETGKSMSELVEFSVMAMPRFPSKKVLRCLK
jgi:hypothetical protein